MSPIAHPFFLLAAALALWQLLAYAAAPPSWGKTLVKTGAVAALAGLALALAAPWLVVAGLALGAAGDYFLSRPGQAAFLAGMAAFAAGHLAYAGWFWRLGVALPPLPAALAVSALALAAALVIAPRAKGLAGPVRGYIAVILVMALAALGLRAMPLATLGALLFMASDFVLALGLFVLPEGRAKTAAAYLVWALYWPAQALIGMAALFPPAP